MQRGKNMVCAITIMFALLAVACGIISVHDISHEQVLEPPLFLEIEENSGIQKIYLWSTDGNSFYAFLPSYAQLSQTIIRMEENVEVWINDELVSDGSTCEAFNFQKPYSMCYGKQESIQLSSITFLQSANVATIYIDTMTGKMENIHEKKGNKESGQITVYKTDGSMDYQGSLQSIQGRGNSTWDCWEKKPYSIRLASSGNLLGMGEAQRWVLFANAYDPTQLRNKVVYDFAPTVGLRFSPECQWADVYLNGEYSGLYLLSERNEIHENRLSLAQNNSFLVSMEIQWRLMNQAYPYVLTSTNTAFRIHHSAFSEAETKRILMMAERAMLAENGVDPQTGKHWTELIDIDSWARKYVLDEVFCNLDAGSVSHYLYYDGVTEKLYAGPVWDYDHSMEKFWWQGDAAGTLSSGRRYIRSNEDYPWYYALYQIDEFREYVHRIYKTDFFPKVTLLLDNQIDEYQEKVAAAATMNQMRWITENAGERTDTMQEDMRARISFLNSLWIENEEYCIVQVNDFYNQDTKCYVITPGSRIPEHTVMVEGTEIVGWYHVDSEEPFEFSKPIYEDTNIYLKVEEVSESILKRVLRVTPLIIMTTMMFTIGLVDMKLRKKEGHVNKWMKIKL